MYNRVAHVRRGVLVDKTPVHVGNVVNRDVHIGLDDVVGLKCMALEVP